METALRIGSEVTKATSDNVARTVEKIFRVGYATHMDQATICKALDSMAQSFAVNGTTIQGCNINGDKTVNT